MTPRPTLPPQECAPSAQCWRHTLARGLLALALLSGCAGGRTAATPRSATATPLRQPAPSAAVGQPASTPQQAPTAASPASPEASPPSTAPARLIPLERDAVHGVVIQIWNPWSGEAGEMLNTLAQEFTTQNEWKISVTAVPQPGYDAIDGLLEDGRAAPPDLAIAFAYQAAAWRAHPPLDWTPYLQDSLWGLPAAAQADFTAVFWQDGQVNQAQIGLPLLRSAQVLFYNQTWAADLAYRAAPQDPQTFADQACGATSALRRDATAENDGLGGFLASANDAAALSWMMSFGGGVISPTQSTITPPAYAFESEANIQAFTFLRELYEGGCVVFLENRDPLEAFAQRQGLMVGGSVMSIPSQAQIMFAMQNNDAWTVIPYPSPDETAAMVVYGPSLYLTASSPERRLASWLFARWLLEPTQHARLVRATASFPLSSGEMPLLADYVQQYPAYAAAVSLLPHARPEPAWAGWARVRFALADAATQIFRPYFKVEQVPAMLRLLDRTAGELEQP